MNTIFVSIGNSDDKLAQQEWAEFVAAVDDLIQHFAPQIYGVFYSDPASPYQNACWSFGIDDRPARVLRKSLQSLRKKFRQDSIAWNPSMTEFI